MAGELSRAIAADLTVTRANLEYLHVLWQLDKKLFIALQVVNVGGVAIREGGHRLDAFPVGNRDELRFVGAIFPERLDAHCFFDQRFDADFVVVGLVLVSSFRLGATAPNAGDGRPLRPVLGIHIEFS